MRKDVRRIEISSRAQWRSWLHDNGNQAESIWLVTFKKSAGDRYVPYNDVVEEALCFGWVDSLPRKLDESRTMLLLSPRKPRSAWSRANKDRVERMIAAGSMTPAGLARVAEAKKDGSWSKLDAVEELIVPDDLATALNDRPDAADNFNAFPKSTRRGILEWILQAKRAETRAKRIAETADLAAKNRRANQFTKR